MKPPFTALQDSLQQAMLLNQAAPPGLLTDRGTEQLSVYLNAYRARLQAALRENYSLLPRLLGDDAFADLAAAYIAATPSQRPSLRWFGHALPDFMQQRPTLCPHPALVDFARLEWSMGLALDAGDMPTLTPADLADYAPADWATLRFCLHPSAQLLPLDWAVAPLWHALKNGADEVPEPSPCVHTVLVWRRGWQPSWRSLAAPVASFIGGMRDGLDFASLCSQLALHSDAESAAQVAASELRQLLDAGVLTQALAQFQPSL